MTDALTCRRIMADSQDEVEIDLSQRFIEDLDDSEQDQTLEPEHLATALDNCAEFHLNAEAIGAEEPVSFTELLLSGFDLESHAWQPDYVYQPTPRVLHGLNPVARPVITSGAT